MTSKRTYARHSADPENDVTLILDCNYIGHAGLHTMKDLSHQGVVTGVLFGFLSRVLHLGTMFNTNNILFCWDSIHSYRKRIFPEYKAAREEAKRSPEEIQQLKIMRAQLRLLRTTLLPEIGFKNQFLQEGCESDDLMAKLVKGQHGNFVIVSEDRDLYQLLQSNVRLYTPRKHRMFTRNTLWEEYGVTPEMWTQVKAVGGCTSDGVPGIPGVAEKTALKYLKAELKQNNATYQAIRAGTTLINRNLKLVSLPIPPTRIPVEVANDFSLPAFRSICDEFGLNSFLEQLENWQALFNMGGVK